MRVYFPTLVSEIPTLVTAGRLDGRLAFTASPAFLAAVRAEYGDDADEEFAEYLAMYEAAYASINLIANDAAAVPLRLVLAADVAETGAQLVPGDSGGVQVGSLGLPDVVSAHIDEDTVQLRTAIKDVVKVLGTAANNPGSESDSLMISDVASAVIEEAELLWYDSTELTTLPQQ